MPAPEINRGFDEMKRLFEEFKSENTKQIEELKKGKSDPLLEEKLQRMNAGMDTITARMEKLEARPNGAATQEDPKAAQEKLHQLAKAGMQKWMRKGMISAEDQKAIVDALPAEVKALSVGSDPDGGYFVRPEMGAAITKRVYESSPMRELADVITISSNQYEELYDFDAPDTEWGGEAATPSTTGSNAINKIIIPVHELRAKPRATQAILDDASIDIEAWHAGKVAEQFGRDQATAFVTGNGVTRPRGFTTYASGTSFGQIEQVSSGSAAALTANGLIDLQVALFEPYQRNATWLMRRATAGAIRKLVQGTGDYLWSVERGLTGAPQDSLLGRPVRFAADMAAVGAGNLAVAYGDFKAGYLIVDRIGIRVLRDPFSAKPFVEFYSVSRVGGGVKNWQSIKLQVVQA